MPAAFTARALAVVLLATVALACGEEGVTIRSPPVHDAQALVQSVGVNVHMSYSDTPYADVDAVRRRLQELGVRHVRDGLVLGRPDQYDALNALAADGVRTQFILGDPQGRFGTGSLDDQIATLRDEVRGAASAVEGPNEYDVSGDPRWRENLTGYQQRLFAAVKADPALAGLPVVGPSLVLPASRSALGDLTGSLDLGNLHPYPGGGPPESNVRVELDLAQEVSGRRPVVATETGYHDALAARNGQPPVSQDAAAIYVPRLFLTYFRAGIRRTFAYELIDERPDPARRDPEANFGLLREDLTPKPAFASLRNLIAVLNVSGEEAPPPPAHRVVGDVESLSLRRRDGSVCDVLWQDVAVWDERRRLSLDVPARPVRLEVAEAARVEVFRPVRSSEPEERLEVEGELALDVAADPLVVCLTAP